MSHENVLLMKLPNGHRAVVDLRKLTEYCLNAGHLRGRHKARVFAAALDLTVADAGELKQLLLLAAASDDAQPAGVDQFGVQYVLDFDVSRGPWTARVRSRWIIRNDDVTPQLTTCYVLT